MKIVRWMAGVSVGIIAVLSQTRIATAQLKPPSSSDQSNQSIESLNPSSNPLELPTAPQQVQIQQTQPITLQQAIELARRNNRELQIAEQILQRSQAALRQARAALYPSLTGEAEIGYERSVQDRLDDLKYLGEDASPTGILGGTVEVSYDLFTAGRRPAQIQAAQAQVRIDQLEVERFKEQVRLDVVNAYYDVQQADEEVRINRAAVTNTRRSLEDSTALETGGLGTRLDIIRARVQLGNAEQELIDVQNRQDISRRQLVQLLSLGESADVSAADLVRQAGEWRLSLEESIILAYKNRVEFQQQLAQRTIADQQRRAALAGIKPQISLFGNYQFLNEFNEPFGLLHGYAVGARLRWTAFDGGSARAAAGQEDANRAIAETRFAQTRNQVRFQVEQAYKTLQASTHSIQTATIALGEAREALETIRFRFQQGVGTQLDIITAQNDLVRADVNRLKAILSYNRALAALQRAVSNFLPDSPSTPISR